MKISIKYCVTLVSILLSLIVGYEVYAESTISTNSNSAVCTQDAKVCPDGSYVGRSGPNCEFVCKNSKDTNSLKDSVKNNLDGKKEMINSIIQSAKQKRGEYKKEITTIKDDAKTKIDEAKNNFKIDLKNIKNENKKIATEKIVNIIQGLNTKTTDNLLEKLNKVDSVLMNIESRTSKAESAGIDTSLVKPEIEKAKIAISTARTTITNQSNKVYSINITDDASIRPEMKKLRDTFSKDTKNLHAQLKSAHRAVMLAAITLAKIPKIDGSNTTTIN